jgi:hypothetical protein
MGAIGVAFDAGFNVEHRAQDLRTHYFSGRPISADAAVAQDDDAGGELRRE